MKNDDILDLFDHEKRKKLDKESELFITLLRSIPEDDIRLIIENTWYSFGELQSRITVYCFKSSPKTYLCPSIVAHKILCSL